MTLLWFLIIKNPLFVVQKSKSSSSAVIPLSRGYNGVGPDSSEDPSIIEKFRRKMLDLEISNTSLMAVNSSLEDTVRVQAQRLNKLKKELTLFKSGMDLNNILTGGDDDKRCEDPRAKLDSFE